MDNATERLANFCFICCKPIKNVESDNQVRNHGEQTASRRFLTLLERYAGMGIVRTKFRGFGSPQTEIGNLEIAACQICMSLSNSFCVLYHQMKCLELQIQWKTDTLMRIMKEAGRVPSRMRLIKKELSCNDTQENIDHGTNKCDLSKNYTKFITLRNDVIKLCSHGLSNNAPKVRLDRNRTNSSTCINAHTKHNFEHDSKYQLVLINWMNSFAALVMLLSISPYSSRKISHSDKRNRECSPAVADCFLADDDMGDELIYGSQESSTEDGHQNEIMKNQILRCPAVSHELLELKYINYSSNCEQTSENESDCAPDPDNDDKVSILPCLPIYANILKHEIETKTAGNAYHDVGEVIPEDFNIKHETTLAYNQCQNLLQCNSTRKGMRHLNKSHTGTKKNAPHFCKMCQRRYTNYNSYLTHKKSLTHRRKILGTHTGKEGSILPTSGPGMASSNSTVSVDVTHRDSNGESTPSNLVKRGKYMLKISRYNLRVNRKRRNGSLKRERNEKEKCSKDILTTDSSEDDSSDDCSPSSRRSRCRNRAKLTNSAKCTQKLRRSRSKSAVINPHTGHIHTSRIHFCQVSNCIETFYTLESLEEHKKLHGDFKCQFCSVRMGFSKDLANHEMKEHPRTTADEKGMKIRCPRCPYSTFHHNICVRHFLESHLELNARSFVCTICKAISSSADGLRNHKRMFHKLHGRDPSTLERCDQCPAYFLTKIQRINHRRRIHMGIDYRFPKCYECGESFKSYYLLKNHLKTIHRLGKSSEEFEFACDLPKCDKRFKTRDELDRHKFLSQYHNQNNYENNREKVTCQECGKLFNRSGIKRHMKVHRKDRPSEFKCDQCGKTFKQKAQLQIHLKFHEGPEKWEFMCAVCSKKCPTNYNLKHHMRTHTKEKPFVCQVCGEKYAHRHNLRNHVNTIHKDEGVQDNLERVIKKRFYVSRKGKKLGKEFCFTRDQDE